MLRNLIMARLSYTEVSLWRGGNAQKSHHGGGNAQKSHHGGGNAQKSHHGAVGSSSWAGALFWKSATYGCLKHCRLGAVLDSEREAVRV
jgi:hypothetical protein